MNWRVHLYASFLFFVNIFFIWKNFSLLVLYSHHLRHAVLIIYYKSFSLLCISTLYFMGKNFQLFWWIVPSTCIILFVNFNICVYWWTSFSSKCTPLLGYHSVVFIWFCKSSSQMCTFNNIDWSLQFLFQWLCVRFLMCWQNHKPFQPVCQYMPLK